MPGSLFLPHGAPDLAVSPIPAQRFLRELGATPPRPDGIVIVSAHWETRGLELTVAPELPTIHDFTGFPTALYRLHYPARTAPHLIEAVRNGLTDGGYSLVENRTRGLDHGAWIPLLLAYPEADIPVVQLSLDRTLDPAALYDLGTALSVLRERNILIVGSGSTVHNLRHAAPEGSPTPDWAREFDAWLDRALRQGDWDSLFAFRRSEYGPIAHPTDEHLRPLFLAAGAGRARDPGSAARKIHDGFSHGSVGMAAWAFGHAA